MVPLSLSPSRGRPEAVGAMLAQKRTRPPQECKHGIADPPGPPLLQSLLSSRPLCPAHPAEAAAPTSRPYKRAGTASDPLPPPEFIFDWDSFLIITIINVFVIIISVVVIMSITGVVFIVIVIIMSVIVIIIGVIIIIIVVL